MDELKQIDKPVDYELPDELDDNSVVVLPERVNSEGIALYTQESMNIFKDLRENDELNVSYLETPNGKKWIDRLGNGDITLVALFVACSTNLFSSALWYVIQRYAIERSTSQNTKIKITIANKKNDPTWIWYEFEGSPKAVADLAKRVIDDQSKKAKNLR